MKNVAVILSGSGVYDGAELHESVLTLLALERAGAKYTCFAPNINQHHVVNHLTGEVDENDSRNVLVEAARIARGDIQDVAELDAADFDALMLPGGFGAAKNLCTFAVAGPESQVNADVLKACKSFAEAGKPAAYACIAPAIIPAVYPAGVKLTIGTDAGTAEGLEAMGATHVNADVDGVVYDEANKVFSTPAYMLATSISEAATSIENVVSKLVAAID